MLTQTAQNSGYEDFPVTDITLYIDQPMLDKIDNIVDQANGRLNRNAVISYLIDCGLETADFSDFIR